jgi:hypothetical protein
LVIDLPGLAQISTPDRLKPQVLGLKFPPENLNDSVGFLFDFSFSEMDNAVAGGFEGAIGNGFVGVSKGPPRSIYLDCQSLVFPEEVDHHLGHAFASHAPLKSLAAKTLPPARRIRVLPHRGVLKLRSAPWRCPLLELQVLQG